MENIYQHVNAYKNTLKRHEIQEGYQGLMRFINRFRFRLQKSYPEYNIPSCIHEGQMDMSYFACSPEQIKQNKLKIAVVFDHETFAFEIWLVGQNKKVQKQYWEMFKQSDWDVYALTKSPEHAIVMHELTRDPNFEETEELNEFLEHGVVEFIECIKEVLAIE